MMKIFTSELRTNYGLHLTSGLIMLQTEILTMTSDTNIWTWTAFDLILSSLKELSSNHGQALNIKSWTFCLFVLTVVLHHNGWSCCWRSKEMNTNSIVVEEGSDKYKAVPDGMGKWNDAVTLEENHS